MITPKDWVMGIMLALLIFVLILQSNIAEEKLEGYTLIKNQSNDWYWLQSQEYTQTQLNEYYSLKNILISNECIDGGFIQNYNGNEFVIVCYEPKKTLNEVRQ